MGLTFEWHRQKAVGNIKKHKVAYEEAITVFSDPLSATFADPDHSDDEERFLIVGRSNQGRLLIVAFAERGARLRIISARLLTSRERQQYEEAEDQRGR
jgi:uncharacterized DUF497 family protein